MWQFDFTAPTFIVLLFFLVFYFLRPILITKSNRHFCVLVISEVIGFLITFYSSYVGNNYEDFSRPFIIFISILYYTFYTLRFFLFTSYFASLLDLKGRMKVINFISILNFTLIVALIIISSVTGSIFSVSSDGFFSVGDKLYLIYFANIVTIVLSLCYFISNKKRIVIKDKISIVGSQAILLSSCIIDLYYNEYLISDMFFLLVLHLLFINFENPDLYSEKKTTLFNTWAFKIAIKDFQRKKSDFSVTGFVIMNYEEIRGIYGAKQIDMLLKDIGTYLSINFSSLNFYYLHDGRFSVIYKKDKINYSIEEKLEERFKKSWNLTRGASILLKISTIDLADDLKYESYEYLRACTEEVIRNCTKGHATIDRSVYNEVLHNIKVLKALNRSLENNTLLVYYQPIIDAKTREIVGAEALVRMEDEELGLIPPDEFITLSEQNGSIQLLSEQVLEKVCIFINELKKDNISLNFINVNLSPLQCLDPYLSLYANRIVDKYKIDHKNIHIEITEDFMVNKEILKKQMDDFIDKGYKMSLDDFGSGFSNLSLIKSLPFSNIKLDMSIVNEHFVNPDHMLPGIVDIFKKKGLSVTAEGVETKEMADELEKMGCNYLQGYYFSKPLPESIIKNILLSN